jgi:ABC transporter substrate binding protein
MALAEGQYDRLSSLAGELVGRDVAVLVAFDAPASFSAKAATKTTPIVFLTGADPVEIGLVQSFSRPSGNLTGISSIPSFSGVFSNKRIKRAENLSEKNRNQPIDGEDRHDRPERIEYWSTV